MARRALTGDHVSHPHSHRQAAPRRSTGRLRRLIIWEWAVVLGLLGGLVVTLLAMSHGPDPRRQADAVVGQMKAAAEGRPLGDPLFGAYPSVSGSRGEVLVSMAGIPPKVCVLASWELYRTGIISVNGVTPQRVSAARLVDLCNADDSATIDWSPRVGG